MNKKGYIIIITVILLILIALIVSTVTKKSSTNKYDKTFTISLYSNSSTGYNWHYNLSKEGIIEIEESYDNSNCKEGVVGCGGKKIYKIKALKEGKVKLSLKYKRTSSYKSGSKATYIITVDKNLQITEKHYGSYFKKD